MKIPQIKVLSCQKNSYKEMKKRKISHFSFLCEKWKLLARFDVIEYRNKRKRKNIAMP